MQLRTDNIGHFDNPTEKNIRKAVTYSGEGGQEGDIVSAWTETLFSDLYNWLHLLKKPTLKNEDFP